MCIRRFKSYRIRSLWPSVWRFFFSNIGACTYIRTLGTGSIISTCTLMRANTVSSVIFTHFSQKSWSKVKNHQKWSRIEHCPKWLQMSPNSHIKSHRGPFHLYVYCTWGHLYFLYLIVCESDLQPGASLPTYQEIFQSPIKSGSHSKWFL